jgi:DNA-directed RNA polymerase
VQYYIHGNVRKVWAQYGEPSGPKKSTGYYENTLQLSVSCLEEPVMSPKKQAQGAAPNIIHSLDAAHLSLVVNACDFPVTTVHDSFGCLPEDMDDLYNETRTQFATLYMGDPLGSIMRETGQTLEGLDLGTFSIFEVLESEYAFS